MSAGHLRLQHRIVIPFVLVALVTSSVAAYVALSLITRALQSRVAAQVQNTAAVVSRSDFALNTSILRTVKEITGADVITYTTAGNVLASTVDPEKIGALRSDVIALEPTRAAMSATDGQTVLRQTRCSGVPCFVAYRRVVSRPDTIVALVAETSELSAATAAITRTIVLATGLGVVVMVLVSQIVTRRVTGPLDRLVAFTRDVSPGGSRRYAAAGDDEIGRLAAAFNEMLDRLAGAQDALVRSEKLAVTGLLAARVAHDIRNPLSSIKMQAQLLQSRCRSDHEQTILHAILHDIDQVESVVRGLLELARPGELKLNTTSLNDVVREVLYQLSPQLTHQKIAVMSHLGENLPSIQLDANRFKQALLNVLVNAAEAMPAQGGTLTVATRTSDSMLALDVSDDGAGVDPAVLDRVFDPFVSTKREGVGLGLVNTKAVVESHGGTISLTSRQPKGTCVTMRFPLPIQPAGPSSSPEALRG
jgi:signal transduction histidine kinase